MYSFEFASIMVRGLFPGKPSDTRHDTKANSITKARREDDRHSQFDLQDDLAPRLSSIESNRTSIALHSITLFNDNMSRWLSSVNNLLEKLDDRAETVSGETTDTMETTARTAAALAGRFLGGNSRRADGSSDDDDEYEGSYLDSGEEEEYYEDEEEGEFEDDDEYEDEEEQDDEEVEEEEIAINLGADPDESQNSTPLFDDDRVADIIADTNDTNETETTQSPPPSTPVDIDIDIDLDGYGYFTCTGGYRDIATTRLRHKCKYSYGGGR
jgi:hypothetical protein